MCLLPYVRQIARSVLGAIQGPLLGIFALAAIFPCANWIVSILYFCFVFPCLPSLYFMDPYELEGRYKILHI